MLKKDLIKKVKDLENTVQKLRLAVLHNTSIISNYTKQILIANSTIDKLENESSVIVDSTNEDMNTDMNTNTIKNVYSTIQEYRRIVSNLTPIVDFDDYKINNVDVKRQMKKGYVGTVSDIIDDDSDSIDIETPIFDFSLTKVVNKLSYCNPELVNWYSLLDLLMVNWSNIEPCEYEQTLDRGKDYDLRRISYFLKNGVGDEPLDLEYDGQTLVINDGNHRFAALLLSFIKTNIDPNKVVDVVYHLDLLEEYNTITFKGRLYGFQDILIDLL